MARSIQVILTANPTGYIAAMAKADAASKKVGASAAAMGAEVDAAGKLTAKSAATVKASFTSQEATARRAAVRMRADLAAQEAAMAKATAAATKYGRVTAAVGRNQAGLASAARGLGLVGVAAGVALGAAVKQAADFNSQMARVGAFSDDAREHMTDLRKVAMTAGEGIGYSAKDAASAMEEMVKAGISASDMLNGGLRGALQLAAAGQIDVAQATEIASASMTQFGLEGKDIGHVADLLAAGADKALGGVSDLGEGLKYAGTTAHQAGVSIDDTVGVLAEFASYGMLGSMAGTTLKQMFIKLAAPSKKAADLMDDLGINAYDASGKFVGMANYAGILQKQLGKLAPAQRQNALATIFGARAMQGANILMSEGADGVNKWIDAVNDQGFAALTAARKLDSLTGDMTKFKTTLTTALIEGGESSQSALRDIVQGATNVVSAWNNMSESSKSAVMKIVGELALLGLGGAAVIKVVTGAAAMRKALIDIGLTSLARPIKAMRELKTGATAAGEALTTMGRAGRIAQLSLPLVGLALAGITTAVTLYQTKASVSAKATEDFGDAFEQMEGKINKATIAMDNNIRASTVKKLQDDGALEAARKLGLGMDTVTDAAMGNAAAMSNVQRRIDEARQAGTRYDARSGVTTYSEEAKAAGKLGGSLHQTTAEIGHQAQAERDKREALLGATGAQQEAKKAADDARDAYKEQGVATDDLSDADVTLMYQADQLAKAHEELDKQTNKVIDSFTVLRDGALDTARAADNFHSALNDLSKQAADTAGAQEGLRSAQEKVADSERNLRKVRNDSKSTADDVRKAERQLRDARNDLTKAQQKSSDATSQNSKTLKGNSDVAIANRNKIRDAISAMNDKATADFKAKAQTGDLTSAVKDSSKKLQQQKEDLIKAAQKAGYNRSEVKKMVDQMVLTPKELKTQVNTPGVTDAKSKIKALQDQINDLKGSHEVKIDYKVLAGGKAIKLAGAGGGRVISGNDGDTQGYASGGFIRGPGTGTSDSITARLSNGEYVIKEKSVRAIGRDRLDFMNQMGDLPAFRDGGLVNHGGLNTGGNGAVAPAVVPVIPIEASVPTEAIKALASAIDNTNVSIQKQAIAYLQGALTSEGGLIGAGSFAKALAFAQSQAGKPYVWAAAGPGGYDCSGFMGAIQNVIEGKSPYSRRWSTMAFNGQEQAQGFTKNADSAFKIGVTNAGVGHTAGTINGVNVESRGGEGVVVGSRARGWNDSLFPMHYGLTAGMPGKVGISGLPGGGMERPTGSYQQIFRKLMLIAGYPESAWHMVDYIISHESGWRINATNPSSGAYGLGQAYPGSKMAAFGPDWRTSAATQGAWFFDYIKQYGGLTGAYNFWRSHNWYADGGHVTGPGSGRSDSIPAMLSNGEFVVNAQATARNRGLLELLNSNATVAQFATGGQVGTAAFGSSSAFSVAAIVKLIRALDNPTSALAKFTTAVKKAATANTAAAKALKAPKATLDRAKATYDSAVDRRNNLRLTNAQNAASRKKNVDDANKSLKHQKDLLSAAKLALQKLAPAQSKAAKAQSALNSAIAARDAKARSNAEKIAKYNDKIKQAKKGTVAYQNLLNSKELAQKSNARALAAANAKVASAKKAAVKAGVNTAKVEAAQLRVKKAQQAVDKAQNKLDAARSKSTESSRTRTLKMAEANAAVTKASNAKKKAQEAYNKVLEKSKAKTEAYKQAQQDLADQQKALADAALQVSNAFSDAYLSKSSAVADWLQSMSIGTKDITALTSQIAKLRKLGLSETLIQQIIGMAQSNGAPAGQAIADAIIKGGDKTVKKLNDAAVSLQDAADVLGYKAATGTVRAATGGLIRGAGTGTSDSINARLSNGEYVVNARATAQNRAALDMINYGVRGSMRFASGGYVAGPSGGYMSQNQLVKAVAAIVDSRPMISGNNIGYDPAAVGRELDRQRSAKLHNAGVGVFR